MDHKKIIGMALMLLWIVGLGLGGSYAQISPGKSQIVNPELSALLLRKGKESFSRGRYNEAKNLFRKAIQADPDSQTAWSYYDLAQLYAVAEQFKNHGRILNSTAPPLEEASGSPQSGSSSKASKPSRKVGKRITKTAKKEKIASKMPSTIPPKPQNKSAAEGDGRPPAPSISNPFPGGIKSQEEGG
jgi:hypothetical protein